jgi:hypothetical protein
MTVSKLEEAIGGLSKPSKMPGYAYGISPNECDTGTQLRTIENSVCSNCYAHKGCYAFRVVKVAHARRLAILRRNLESWTNNMITLLRFKYRNRGYRDRVFRWHDSGDLQSADHLRAIVTIAERLPEIRFWLPTKERGLIGKYKKPFPSNLVVRVSSPMVGKYSKPPQNSLSSTVDAEIGKRCHASKRDQYCGNCRACWDPTIENIDYPEH